MPVLATRFAHVLSCIGMLFVLVVIGTGCRQKPGPEQIKEANTPPSEPNQAVSPIPAPVEPEDPMVVTVNGVAIRKSAVAAIVDTVMKPLEDSGKYSEAMLAQARKNVRENAVTKLIIERLFADEVKRLGITVSDEEVDAKIADMAGKVDPPVSVEVYLKAQQEAGKGLEAVREEARAQAGYDKLQDTAVSDKVDVTDEEAKTYYDGHPERYHQPEMVRASHIMIRFIDANDPNDKADARERIEGLFKQVKEGADFATVAMDHSDDASATKGGDLGFFERGDMESPFQKAAFGLKEGQISDVVETSYGYHIIKLTGRKPAVDLSFDEVKDEIKKELSFEKKLDGVRKYINELTEKATIEFNPALQASKK